MAVINRIRKYSWVAVSFIAIAIVAFVLADVSRGLGLLGGPDRTVGSIRGTKISIEEFELEFNTLKNNYQAQTGKAPDDQMSSQLREQAWNNLIFKKSYTQEFDNLGITVSDKELTQMVQGDSVFIHPWVRQQFTDPQTNKFDKSKVLLALQQLASAPANSPFRMNWKNFEGEMRKNRQLTKYEDLFKFSTYTTKAEAEQQYVSQNSKAEVKYLYVPYSSIVDSTLASKVTDAELTAYLNKNREKYKSQETRSLDYIVFDIKPSKADSTEFAKEIKQLARDLATAPNDSIFAQLNSDNPNPYQFQALNQIPNVLFNNTPVILKGGIYGPFIDGKSYKIFKVSDVREDSISYVKASHILFSADKNATDEVKANAEKQAKEVLQKIKDGEDFAKLAKQYGSPTDGATANGGDLGWFPKGQMVKPFDDAVFGTESIGLLPNLVKTDFGYHIIKVTHPKTNTSYKLAIVDKVLEPSDKTKNEVLLAAEELKNTSKTGDELRANIKKRPDLILLKAEKIPTTSVSVGTLNNAREIVRWAFKDASIGSVSEVIEIQEDNKYVITTVTGQTTQDASTIADFREELKREVIKEKKIEQITKKLALNASSLEDMAKQYGSAALVNTANDIALNANNFQSTGFNPIAVGKSFGLQKGKRSKPFGDENGVFVLELVKITPAAQIADYSQYKNQILDAQKRGIQYMLSEAIKEASNITDKRYKFY